MTAAIEIVEPGLFTTIQDLGRHGQRRQGIPVSGGMDCFALQLANLLAGNPRTAAALEFALRGPTLRINRDITIALTGADCKAMLDGQPLERWQSAAVRAGQVLTCGAVRDGSWSYLAVNGGVDVPLVFGSRATYTRAGLGGYCGRILKQGDQVSLGTAPSQGRPMVLAGKQIPSYSAAPEIRVILGPQQDFFSAAAIAAFTRESYALTQSDRMGYRLKGPALDHTQHEMLTDAVTFGSIQVPADGQPIVLMADCQTTGGYPKIATVVNVDLGRVAQVRPGGSVRFVPVSIETAQDLAIEQERILQQLQSSALT